jgi:hypothetical protein
VPENDHLLVKHVKPDSNLQLKARLLAVGLASFRGTTLRELHDW